MFRFPSTMDPNHCSGVSLIFASRRTVTSVIISTALEWSTGACTSISKSNPFESRRAKKGTSIALVFSAISAADSAVEQVCRELLGFALPVENIKQKHAHTTVFDVSVKTRGSTSALLKNRTREIMHILCIMCIKIGV